MKGDSAEHTGTGIGGTGASAPRGIGRMASQRCDQCHGISMEARKRAKVKRGSLRGMVGLVCAKCRAEPVAKP